jgi:hypothetical protein
MPLVARRGGCFCGLLEKSGSTPYPTKSWSDRYYRKVRAPYKVRVWTFSTIDNQGIDRDDIGDSCNRTLITKYSKPFRCVP